MDIPATSDNIPGTLVLRDASGNLSAGVVTADVTGDIIGDVTGDLTGNVTGNSSTATALQTSRTIELTGDVTGSASFDGTANASITASLSSGVIVDADVKSDAAIAGSKVTPTFGAQDITVSGADRSITNTDNFALLFGTNNTTRVSIPASGGLSVSNGNITCSGTITDYRGLALVNTSGVQVQLAANGDVTGDLRTVTNHPLTFLTNNTERMRIAAGGEVYIAGTTDRGAFNLQCNGTGVWGSGAYTNGSDERLKENIAEITEGLEVVKKLRPVSFNYKPEHSKDTSKQAGFIAQELLVALEGKDYLEGTVSQGPEFYNVAYQNLIPVMAKAIQELTAKVEALEALEAALQPQ